MVASSVAVKKEPQIPTDKSRTPGKKMSAGSSTLSSDDARNKMGFVQCTSYVVGSIIGSGIFITPSGVLEKTKSIGLSLCVWVFCGIISILGSLCYIELGTSIPDPGCDFAYACFVGWKAAAFAFMWVSVLLTYPASAAIQAKTFAEYITNGMEPVYKFEPPYEEIVERTLAFTLLFILTVLNLYSLERFAGRFQVVVTVGKVLALLIIIVTGLYLLIFRGWTEHLKDAFAGSVWKPGPLTLAIYGGLWSYSGWDILNYGTPEIHKPRRTMPLSLLTGILLVSVVYTLINVAYFVVLTKSEILDSNAVAADFSQKVLGHFSYAIPFLVSLLMVGTLNSNIFCGSRYMHAAAREGHLPPFLSVVHPASGSPRAAVVAQGLLTLAVSWVDTDTLINYVTFVMWAQRFVTMAALILIRLTGMPVHPDAIRVPVLLSVVFALMSAALCVIPLVTDTKVTLIGIAIVLSGLIFYFSFVRPDKLPTWLERINDWLSQSTCVLTASELDLKPEESEKETRPEELRNLEEEESNNSLQGEDSGTVTRC